MTLKFIGLVILIFLWPSYNSMTAIPDILLDNIYDTSLLLQQAYLQTFFCLLSAVITTLAVRIYGEKIMINHFINSIINVTFENILDWTFNRSFSRRHNRSFCICFTWCSWTHSLSSLLKIYCPFTWKRLSF